MVETAQSPVSDRIDEIAKGVQERRRRQARQNLLMLWAIRIVSALVVLTAWQIYGSQTLEIIFVPFTSVVQAGFDLFVNQNLFDAVLYSVETFLVGLVIGASLGIAVGLLIGWSKKAEAAIGLYIYALYATPMVTLVPLITLWFGVELTAQLIIIVLFVFFPVVVTVYNGVTHVDRGLLDVGRVFGASQLQMWQHIVLPAVVPFIMTGMTQAVAMGLVGMFIAEIFTALSGIGSVLETQANAYHTAPTLATILVIMVLGVGFRYLVSYLQKRLAPWFSEA
ncbi:MAG TPA: ABC transporter permease subunit [Ktedonobacterales bacterium]|nr:ABC transporter permease subunit [Ktedonobacterales bacterium]